ncbi:DivIVA domain-containing protein [Lunatimonas salinarum]|uniref:DivIVA domain-containing protein n=1 Tax=Lunatimonas salinarum TaxID=1774590 RepID=UPI001ADECE11|nr:DivIVA domain-containing protein [Lunatimonas salinarum]
MKITPLDIRQKTFERQIRGYDKEEVSAFLTYLSQEWEKVLDEQRTLQLKFEHADKEAQKLREIEQSLFRTLKTAEDTGASIIEHANNTADQILKEAHMEADLLKSDATNRAKNMQEQAESKSKGVIEDLKEAVSMLTEAYEQLLDQREILLGNLRNLAQDTLENIRISQENFQQIDLSLPKQQVKQLLEGDFLTADADAESYEPEMELILKPEIPDAERIYTEGDEATLPDEGPAEFEAESEEDTPEAASETAEKKEKPESTANPKSKNGTGTGSFFDQFD